MDMFTVLDDRRQFTQDFAQPLSVEDINGVIVLFRIENPETRVEYFRYIISMDRVWMEQHIKQIRDDNEKRKRQMEQQQRTRR